jgi:hypothetical protein
VNQAPVPIEPKKSWFSFFLKMIFFISAFLLIIFTVLANMSGSGDTMKQAVEGFFSDATGYRASIAKFNRLVFFPDIIIDFEQMDFFDGDETTSPVATIGKLHLAMSFWDVMFSTGKIRRMNLEDVTANQGVLIPSAVNIKTARVFDEGDNAALLEIKGSIEDQPLEIRSDMKAFGVAPWKTYRFGPERNVFLKLGDLQASAIIKSQAYEGFRLEEIKIEMPESVAEGFIGVRDRGYQNFAVTGEITLKENGSVFQPDLMLNLEESLPLVSGKIIVPAFYTHDLDDDSRVSSTLDFLKNDIFKQGFFLPPMRADVTFEFARIEGFEEWLSAENLKKIIPDFANGAVIAFPCTSVTGQFDDVGFVFDSVFADTGARLIAASGDYNHEMDALKLDLETAQKTDGQAEGKQYFSLSGTLDKPVLMPASSGKTPPWNGACQTSPGNP